MLGDINGIVCKMMSIKIFSICILKRLFLKLFLKIMYLFFYFVFVFVSEILVLY